MRSKSNNASSAAPPKMEAIILLINSFINEVINAPIAVSNKVISVGMIRAKIPPPPPDIAINATGAITISNGAKRINNGMRSGETNINNGIARIINNGAINGSNAVIIGDNIVRIIGTTTIKAAPNEIITIGKKDKTPRIVIKILKIKLTIASGIAIDLNALCGFALMPEDFLTHPKATPPVIIPAIEKRIEIPNARGTNNNNGNITIPIEKITAPPTGPISPASKNIVMEIKAITKAVILFFFSISLFIRNPPFLIISLFEILQNKKSAE